MKDIKDIKKQYDKDGFYIAKSILDKKVVNQFNKDCKVIFLQQLKDKKRHEKKSLFDVMCALFKEDLDKYLSTLRLSSKLFSLYKVIDDDAISKIAKGLGLETLAWQTRPVIHCMANELLIPGGYNGVGVHQDWPTLQSSLNNITVWVPFTSVDKDSFPLEVIPGTHKDGLFSGTQKEHYFEIDEEHYNIKDFIPMEAEIGDAVFMSNFTIHRSQTKGKHFRLSVSMRYEDASEKTFIDRNYPFTEQRTVKRDILFPGFPKKSDMKGIY